MANLARVRLVWSGGVGLPGVTTFYAPEADAVALSDAASAWAHAIINGVPNSVTITNYGQGDILDEATGNLMGTWSATPTAEPGGLDPNYAAGVGAYCNWITGDVVNNRRVHGRTFMAPLTSNSYDSSGTINSGALTTLAAACIALRTTANVTLVIWHRPIAGTGGSGHVVVGSQVPDKVTSLRSRRH